jgi:hypothetical protein
MLAEGVQRSGREMMSCIHASSNSPWTCIGSENSIQVVKKAGSKTLSTTPGLSPERILKHSLGSANFATTWYSIGSTDPWSRAKRMDSWQNVNRDHTKILWWIFLLVADVRKKLVD